MNSSQPINSPMINEQVYAVRNLISDLLPIDHISLNTKRVRFINGEGVVLYDDKYAVEIFTPRKAHESYEFFGVHRHRGNVDELYHYFRKPTVLPIDSPRVTRSMKYQFEEAVFQFEPIEDSKPALAFHKTISKKFYEPSQIYLHKRLDGAA